jgi:hypothetical protein
MTEHTKLPIKQRPRYTFNETMDIADTTSIVLTDNQTGKAYRFTENKNSDPSSVTIEMQEDYEPGNFTADTSLTGEPAQEVIGLLKNTIKKLPKKHHAKALATCVINTLEEIMPKKPHEEPQEEKDEPPRIIETNAKKGTGLHHYYCGGINKLTMERETATFRVDTILPKGQQLSFLGERVTFKNGKTTIKNKVEVLNGLDKPLSEPDTVKAFEVAQQIQKELGENPDEILSTILDMAMQEGLIGQKPR